MTEKKKKTGLPGILAKLSEGGYVTPKQATFALRGSHLTKEEGAKYLSAVAKHFKLPANTWTSGWKLTFDGFSALLKQGHFGSPGAAYQKVRLAEMSAEERKKIREQIVVYFGMTYSQHRKAGKASVPKATRGTKKKAHKRNYKKEREAAKAKKAAEAAPVEMHTQRAAAKQSKALHANNPVGQTLEDVLKGLGAKKISVGLAVRISSIGAQLKTLVEQATSEGLGVDEILKIALA